MTPSELITQWAQQHESHALEVQPDGGNGYIVLEVVTPYGDFNVTVDTNFQDA